MRTFSTHYLPGNLVYFQIVGADDPGELTLRTDEGEPIAASIRTIGNDRVFAPEQPIAEGTHLVLEYALQCFGVPPEILPQTFEFTTTAPGAIELGAARLEVEEIGVKYPGRDGEVSFVRVRHWPGDSTGDASPLMDHTYTVDGAPIRAHSIDGVDLIEVPVACRPQVSEAMRDTCGTLYAAPPGKHRVEAATHVVGSSTQPEPVSLEVDVQCPDSDAADSIGDHEPPPSTPDGDRAKPSEESTADTAASVALGDVEAGGEPHPEPAAAPVASGQGSACTLGASGSQAGGCGISALVAALLLAGVRRCSRRSVA